MNKKESTKTVVVTGDVTIDWNIARVQQKGSVSHVWNAEDLTCAFFQRGGAALLADLIEAVAKKLRQPKPANVKILQTNAPRDAVAPGDNQFDHSYAIWAPYKLAESGSSQGENVWRVQEFLGLYRACADKSSSDDWKKVVNDPIDPDLIILADANLGFRDHPEYWPQALSSETSKPWIILKMAQPLAEGKLWERLQEKHADKLVVVMPVSDLRSTEVKISRQVSWERTAQDLVWELVYNTRVNSFIRCQHVIASFDTVGAILLSRGSKPAPDATLFFDPYLMEGDWAQRYKGYMIGYTSCLAAGIARELIVNARAPNMFRGIQSGMRAMRSLHVKGYGEVESNPQKFQLAFPVSNIAEELAKDVDCLAVAPIKHSEPAQAEGATTPAAGEAPLFWTILEAQNPVLLESVAQEIVRQGLEHAMSGVPVGKFGELITVDRREIEALRSISGLIREYCEGYHKEPLSIAVFGPPGSGKSFAVKQLANSVRPGEIKELTFNLSQFGGTEDLLDAFHQVRDKALSGKIPLVFWDEFDTALQHQPLGWLRYFLVPMQDGEFQEGQLIHPIGRSIFVFAGGTSPSMEKFGGKLDEEKRRAVKLPDFVSRLRGFLDIIGPNRIEGSEDPHYIIRRAILLRSILERHAPQLLGSESGKEIAHIDKGVLYALLSIEKYRHGARSMQAIVAMSQLSGKTSFERSSLPTEAQLNLHVDGRDLFSLLQRMEPDEDLLEKLAEAAHEVFCDGLRVEGHKYGPRTIRGKKVHNMLKPYSVLSEDEKEVNRNNVRDIPNKLKSVGYVMLPAHSNEAPSEFTSSEIERLARMEHERWMREKLDTGWKYAKTKNKAKKLHPCLASWDTLPTDEQDKDLGLVTGIPKIIAKAGYTMVKKI